MQDEIYIEKSADETDHASKIELATTAEAIRAQREKAKPQQVPNEDGSYNITECIDCGDEIVKGRLKLGYIRCVHCAEKKDRHDQLYR